ncbi:MAG: glycosyltransferase [Lachnospiraceae bacterium]|nr:glycosyltransferase [Lachnospiraceae bacterium]
MNEQTKALLKSEIDKAKLVSFDIFDTLLFRKTNSPEIIFDLVGKHFQLHGFRKLRMDEQNEASRRAYAAHGYPHANMDQIYEVLAEHTEIPVDWSEVKAYEIQMERDALTANREMLEIFQYAKNQGKRVVITSDMYLTADILAEFLEEKGFSGFDHLYCSADEHKAKFNRELFELVAERENVAYGDILHIGDKERDDGEYPGSFGIRTFIYEADADLEKVKNAAGSDVDKGIYKILADNERGFWYNLGVEVGGPLYLGLYRFMLDKALKENKKIYFLSRDGYNLYHLFKQNGYENAEYLYTSRRALTLAAITEMNERDIESLPPYIYGQTVGEILDYLGVARKSVRHLRDVGFRSYNDVIHTEQERQAFKQLYLYDKEVFLARCAKERENALRYFEKIGFLAQDAICFDCGWQGSSQELIEWFKVAVGCDTRHDFVYFGIKNSDKSRRQLHGMRYDTYLFDFYKNYALQADVNQNVVMYELLFSAPHESVYCYGENGEVIFEKGEGDQEKAEMLAGICDFVQEGMEFVRTYDVEYTPEIAVGHLKRLIHLPTEEEAEKIGDLQNVDGFARLKRQAKYIAYVTQEQLDTNPNIEIYWLQGLLKRHDIPEAVKRVCAARNGIVYPGRNPEYHLEDEHSIRNYHRWLRHEECHPHAVTNLAYRPRFSIVIPVYNTVTEQLEECIQSVLKQTYTNFELILVDDCSSWDNVVPVLRRYEANSHVHVIYRSTNGHISVATNDGIQIAEGDYIVFMDCDDTIEPDALYAFAQKLNENSELDFLYSDEDKLTEDGKIRHLPFFKPDWSPDLFLNMMYTNHLAAYRASIVKAVGGLRTAYNGSQDYDFTLRFMERSDNKRVGHIPRVLYHWRERKESVAYAMTSKNYASEAAKHAKEDYIRRNGIPAYLEYIDGMSQHRIIYEVVGEPLVSIIIPSRDHPDILRQCIESIRKYTSYGHYELIVVDNGSLGVNRQIIEQYLQSVGAKYIYEQAAFNFSRMCNQGAACAEGEYLLFLNDDIEIFQPQWLERMLGHAQQAHVGAVGAKLFYPLSTRIQHAGISNPKNGPMHSFMTLDDQTPYYFGWNRVDEDCIAVTGACLLLERTKFKAVGGFDEDLPVAYNDVKLCFELHRKGYYNVIRNDVVAYHHESLSRGGDMLDDQKLLRLSRERAELFSDFAELKDCDPYLNKNLKGLTAGLSIKHDYDVLEELDLAGCVPVGTAVVDFVNITDSVQITGWSVLEGEGHIEELERYVVFKDPFGKTYGAKAFSFSRPDVAAHFGQPSYLYAGFECTLQRTDLRVDIIPYQIGVMTRARNGVRYLVWCQEINVVRNPKPRALALGDKKLKNFEKRDGSDIQWSLDDCDRGDSFHRIRGFAFKRGNDHHRYSKSLILLNQRGDAYEFEVYPEERIDVAFSFVNEHFLFYTGFVCYVFDSVLERGHEYEVIIRLRNQFDPADIRDIATGRKVCL